MDPIIIIFFFALVNATFKRCQSERRESLGRSSEDKGEGGEEGGEEEGEEEVEEEEDDDEVVVKK